jgi:putative DNA primase/helicase
MNIPFRKLELIDAEQAKIMMPSTGVHPQSRNSPVAVSDQGDDIRNPNVWTDSHGDIRNAKAFAALSKGKVLFVTTRNKWLQWFENKWTLCEKEEHVAFAKKCCTKILNEASSVFSERPELGRRLIQEAVNAHNLPRIQAMLKLAVSEPDMAITDRELDTNPYQLGVSNGIVDLRTGLHAENLPQNHISRYCNAEYEDDAVCPQWERFLLQIFDEDVETIESVQRLLGYTLTGLVTEEVAVICFGYGSNGKSVFSNVIFKIFGSYAITAPSTLMTTRRSDDASPRNDLASLAGARYVSVNEFQAGDRLDEQVIKMIAGREPITARFLHKEFFEFMPTFTTWVRTNHKPIITGDDDGIWRRLVMLRFGRTFSEYEKDPYLEEKLLAEKEGILQWILEGTRMYLADGLKLSPRIRAEHAKYRNESDLLGEFLSDVMEIDEEVKINQKDAYQAWGNWCQTNGFRVSAKKSFTQRLAERGFPEGKSGNYRYYVGMKIKLT